MKSEEIIRVLFISADPTNATRLRVSQEIREIKEKLQMAKKREQLQFESIQAARPGDVSQAIYDFEPHIVHFSGHGTETGDLCFENVQGKVKFVSPDALAKLFKMESERVECVILNACHTYTQAESVANYIPYVIGMKRQIGDKAAIAFSVGFYKSLGSSRSIEASFEAGCVEISLEGIPEDLTPELYKKKAQRRQSNLL